MQCKFSVVVPVYNSEKSLAELYERVAAVFEKMNTSFEVIFINDYSRDSSYAVLRDIHKAHPGTTTVIDLLRNYGQHNALMCGFNYARGEYIITIDDDLQNPPEEIVGMYEKLEAEKFDVVFGIPKVKQHKSYKNLGSLMVRKLNRKIFNMKDKLRFSSFRIIRKEIVNEIKTIRTPYPYISGMLLTITTAVGNYEVEHRTRQYGSSNYGIRKLVKLALNLLINYSSIPLRSIGVFGFSISLLSFFIGLGFVIKELFVGKAPEGWTTIVVLVSFYNALLLLFFSILGEYIFRILQESSKVSQYAIRNIQHVVSDQTIEEKAVIADNIKSVD